MSEHEWPGHDDHGGAEHDPHDDLVAPDHDDLFTGLPEHDLPGLHDDGDPGDHPPAWPGEHGPDEPAAPDPGHATPETVTADDHGGGGEPVTLGADPDALPDVAGDPLDVFPPPVDAGDLPEPVDGFPWIDPAGLGVPGPEASVPDAGADPGGLAEYAAADLTGDDDPWARLAASDDPATSALARWWSPGPDAGDSR